MAPLDFISHKPGISSMLLGPLLAVQTLMAHGLQSQAPENSALPAS